MYKDYSAFKRENLYDLRLARLEKEGPQGNKKKYVRNIKSLQRHLDEARMGNGDSYNDGANLFDRSHVHFEEEKLDTKDNKNRVRQGGPWKINKNKK